MINNRTIFWVTIGQYFEEYFGSCNHFSIHHIYGIFYAHFDVNILYIMMAPFMEKIGRLSNATKFNWLMFLTIATLVKYLHILTKQCSAKYQVLFWKKWEKLIVLKFYGYVWTTYTTCIFTFFFIFLIYKHWKPF